MFGIFCRFYPETIPISFVQKTRRHPAKILPSNATAFWLHIEKTGTSLFNTVHNFVCPEYDIGKWNGTFMDNDVIRAFPWNKTKCVFEYGNPMRCLGCHWPVSKPTFSVFTMFRDPVQRMISGYEYGIHLGFGFEGNKKKHKNRSRTSQITLRSPVC